MKWRQRDNELLFNERVGNLNFLYNLQVAMHRYCRTRNVGELAKEFPPVSIAKRIAELAGAEIR